MTFVEELKKRKEQIDRKKSNMESKFENDCKKFIDKILSIPNTEYAKHLIEYDKLEKEFLENGEAFVQVWRFGISAFDNSDFYHLRKEWRELKQFQNEYFLIDNYDTNTVGIKYSDKFIEEKLIPGFIELGFKVEYIGRRPNFVECDNVYRISL